jgi:excinuclease UvrABC ATPase subunit
MCPRCEGAGRIDDIDVDELVDWDKSLNEGPIKLADYAVGKWYWEIFASSGFFDLDKKLRDYSPRSSSSSCAARPPRSRPRP